MSGADLPSLGPAVPLGGQNDLTEQDRLQQCNLAIGQALLKFNCDLVSSPHITPEGRVVAEVKLILKER